MPGATAVARTTAPTNAIVAATITEDQINAALREAGLIEPESESTFNRISMNGFMFTFSDGSVATSNPKTGAPAFVARILDLPVEYQAAWLTEPLARAIGREGETGFCKSHFDVPNEARKFSVSGANCQTCPIGPFVKVENLPAEAEKKKCAWKADLSLQVLDDNGEISDPTVHTFSLSTTGIIEWKGTGKNPVEGSASDLNFIQKLARFGAANDPENPTRGMAVALTALRMGGVIAEVRALPMKSSDGARSWTVASFTPIRIIDVAETPALPEGTPATAGTGNDDDLPF